jgi:acyl transferase domain-containing protein
VGRLRDLESSGLSVTQVAASLAGRAVHDVRGVLVGSSWAEMVAADPAFSRVRRGGRTVFVFPGQGSQWPGMARQLYDADLRFRGALDEVLEHVDTARDAEPLADLMWDPDGEARLRLTENAQPALFAVEAALARWLIDVGVEPHIVIGHSVGEIAAAHAAGVLDLRDASRLVVARGRAMCEVEERGAMAFAALGEDEAVDVLREHPDLELAAVNGPGSVVLAGAATALDAALAALAARGIHGRHLNVSHAFHTRHMRAAAVALAPIAQGVTYRPPTRRMILACSGADADDATIWPRYWCDQMVVPVRFAAALDAAGDPASLCFVEVGPGRALTALTRRRVTEPSRATALLGDGRSGEFEMTRHSLGDLWRHGASVDWTRVNPQAPSVPLPPYPFDGERYWLTSGLTPLATSAERGPGPSSDTDSQDDELPAGATGGVVLSAALDLTDAADCRDLVLKTCAQVLGHRDHGGINPVLGLLEQGFDSLMALELQARLVATSGLSVTPDILTTLTTPADIAEHVLMLARRDWRRRGQAPTSALGLGRDTTGQAAADRSLPIAAPRRKAPQTAGEGELARSFLDARGDDDILDAIEAMCAAAEDAPYFESPAAAPRVSTVRLRPDRDGPVLVLLPSFLPGSGAHQFARLATAVPQGLRLEALPLPGLRPGEELPGSWDALLGALAPAVMEASRGAGVVLGGFSVGGVIAHALAAHLEGQGALVDGVLLLDTYEPLGAAARRGFGEAMRHLLDMPRELVPMEDARLIATGCYVAILQEWRPGRIEAPTLLVRASNPLRGAEPWSRADETTTVPGDHFDLVAEGSAPVGAVVGDWLARLGVLALDRAGGHP